MKVNIYTFLLILSGLLVQSCSEFLEEDLITDVTADNYFQQVSGFEDGIRGIYESLDLFWGSEMGMTFTELGTDYHTNGADGSHKEFNLYDSRLSPSGDDYINDTDFDDALWPLMYTSINQCNAMIARANQVQGMDESLKQMRIGEARFLRGLFYFTLVQHFGDVHLSLEETQGVKLDANKTDRLEIYAQAIIPDFEAAASVLPLPDAQPDYGRPTRPVAEFFLAKAFMRRGWNNDNLTDFERAQTLLDRIINSYDFALLDNWGDLWDQDNQINSEIIWAVQNTTNLSLNGSGNRFHLYFLMEYDKLPGMTRDTENGRPWKRARPTRWAEALYNDVTGIDPASGLATQPQALGTRADVRYELGYKHVWYCNNPGTYGAIDFIADRDFVLEEGDTAIFIPHMPMSDTQRIAKNYQIFTPVEYTEKIYPALNKFADPRRDNRQRVQGSRDFIMARLADAYLLAAEAAFKLGKLTNAAEYINAVRERAAREGREEEMIITANQVTIDYILDERARELAGEMHRWADLTRTGKLVERVIKYNPQAAPNIQDYHILRPIPQSQVDAVEGEYQQNPGYAGS